MSFGAVLFPTNKPPRTLRNFSFLISNHHLFLYAGHANKGLTVNERKRSPTSSTGLSANARASPPYIYRRAQTLANAFTWPERKRPGHHSPTLIDERKRASNHLLHASSHSIPILSWFPALRAPNNLTRTAALPLQRMLPLTIHYAYTASLRPKPPDPSCAKPHTTPLFIPSPSHITRLHLRKRQPSQTLKFMPAATRQTKKQDNPLPKAPARLSNRYVTSHLLVQTAPTPPPSNLQRTLPPKADAYKAHHAPDHEQLANTLAVRNVTVVVLDIKPIVTENYNIAYYQCDVSKWEEVEAASKKVIEEIGQPTMLVNNAGVVQG
ncbi:hypothetical protein BDR03DRAFT_1009495 [Suillus americanus]|nr:hypothetical protein BDR03DRAFT_1009495 [Suillus americanus]